MAEFKDLFQTADWKTEKHVPVIESPDSVNKGEFFKVNVSVGKQIAHPNTTEHHIRWINVYFYPAGEKFPCHLGRFEFNAHGEAVQAPNSSTIYTNPDVVLSFKTDKPGDIFAESYCNIHGLWQNKKTISIK